MAIYKTDIVISEEERGILRGLAQEYANIAALPIHKEKAVLWTKLNDLEPVRPLVWINELCWHELNYEDELTIQCKSEWAVEKETFLRQQIYLWKHMPGDMIINDYLPCRLAVTNTEHGLEEDVDIVKTDEASGVVSRHFNAQIKDPEDIEKIKMPIVTHDEEATERDYQKMQDVFGDIIAVKKEGIKHIWFTPWDYLIRFWGVQDAMMDLVMRPDMVNAIVSKMVDSAMCGLDKMIELNLLTLNNDNTRIGSGGYGHTKDMPGEDFNADHVMPHNMWGCSNAQIFSEISPAMHWEFAVRHDMRWLERWKYTYYGCCEPLDIKMDVMKKIPNLRKISMSPWVDTENSVALMQDKYVYSRKPNPAILAETEWSPERARQELKDFLDKAQGCRIELIMKDVSTVRYEPQRVWEWQRIAMELAEDFKV